MWTNCHTIYSRWSAGSVRYQSLGLTNHIGHILLFTCKEIVVIPRHDPCVANPGKKQGRSRRPQTVCAFLLADVWVCEGEEKLFGFWIELFPRMREKSFLWFFFRLLARAGFVRGPGDVGRVGRRFAAGMQEMCSRCERPTKHFGSGSGSFEVRSGRVGKLVSHSAGRDDEERSR